MTMPALTERERQDRIRRKVLEVSQLIHRMSEIINEFNDLGVDAAFKYTASEDGYGGDLEFMHSVQDKIVHEDDPTEAHMDAAALLNEALSPHSPKH